MREARTWEERADERQGMVRTIEEQVRETAHLLGTDELDPRVMAALLEVPRHEFVPAERQCDAYDSSALPIGHRATISQPYIVAVSTHFARVDRSSTVLEVGTGSGYQAAVLAKLADRVFSIERIPALAESAAARLARLGVENVEIRAGDGYEGWPEHAPFDAIVVTAGAEHVPPPLVEQLAPGGRLVVPVAAESGTHQDLVFVEKDESGETSLRNLLPVAFVPLVHGRGGEDAA